jgi:hypothetical protein
MAVRFNALRMIGKYPIGSRLEIFFSNCSTVRQE